MHEGNRRWLRELSTKYEAEFSSGSVLEIGSYNMNGTARDYFSTHKYVGVDCVAGPDVDIVCDATKTVFRPGEFDVLVMLSVFEHTPHWREILRNNIQWLVRGGLLLLCWGAEGNLPHDPQPWAIVPVGDFNEFAKKIPIQILDQFFEEDRFPETADQCPGAYDVLARRV